jgi:hypothetical protein
MEEGRAWGRLKQGLGALEWEALMLNREECWDARDDRTR